MCEFGETRLTLFHWAAQASKTYVEYTAALEDMVRLELIAMNRKLSYTPHDGADFTTLHFTFELPKNLDVIELKAVQDVAKAAAYYVDVFKLRARWVRRI